MADGRTADGCDSTRSGPSTARLLTAGVALDYNVAVQNQMAGDDHLMELFPHSLVTETFKAITADAEAQQGTDTDDGAEDQAEIDLVP